MTSPKSEDLAALIDGLELGAFNLHGDEYVLTKREKFAALLRLARQALRSEPLVEAALHWYDSRVDDEWAGEKLVMAAHEYRKGTP